MTRATAAAVSVWMSPSRSALFPYRVRRGLQVFHRESAGLCVFAEDARHRPRHQCVGDAQPSSFFFPPPRPVRFDPFL